MPLCTRKGIIQWILLCVIHESAFLNQQILTWWCMRRLHVPVDPLLLITAKCDLCEATALMPVKNDNLWHKCPNCFDCGCWSPCFAICVVCYVSAVACSRSQRSTPARGSDRRSMFRQRVPCFCLFSIQPLSENAILTFYRFLYRFPTTYTYTV